MVESLKDFVDIEKIPSFKEIKEYEKDNAIIVLNFLRENHTNNSLLKHWGISSGSYYNLLEKLGLHNPKKGSRKREVNSNNENSEELSKLFKGVEDIKDILNKFLKENQQEVEYEKRSKLHQFSICIDGVFDKKEIENKLLSIAGVVDEQKKYKLSVILEEE